MTSPESTVTTYDFELDRFQVDAIAAIERGEHVVVAAPTGSGKTVVAEMAIDRARRLGRRSLYTAPIKALSNQKYRDLVDLHGRDRVGLLTGDTTINGRGQVVVMTTEVVRNMIYAGERFGDVEVVVLDEVHFLQDAYRGPVWEEVIIHLPEHVRLVCLSATVSNADELGEWIDAIRGTTTVIVEQRRPVELRQHHLLTDRATGSTKLLPTFVDGAPNPEALRLDAAGVRADATRDRRRRPQRRLATPTRTDTLDQLVDHDLLPAIEFIFSRAGCDAAAREVTAAGYRLIDDDAVAAVRDLAERRVRDLAASDLAALGFEQFLTQLTAGIAAHHAGLVPSFKEIVEAAFLAGWVRCVFATETLAVGVNMPARTVVIDRLTKYTGDHHEMLSPAQYTQLTGRAGRRGIDELGHAIVLWSPFVRFEQVAELAASRSFRLRSAFRPTYNMAVNLIANSPPAEARTVLTLSFAQFQADREVVRLERRLARLRERLVADAERAGGDLVDVEAPPGDIGEIERSLGELRPGDVIHFSRGRHHGPVAVVASAHRRAGIRLTVITPSGHATRATATDFGEPPRPLGSVVLPGHFAAHDRAYRTEVGERIRRAELRPSVSPRRTAPEGPPAGADQRRAAKRVRRARSEIVELEQRIEQRTARLATEFDAVVAVLHDRGHVDAEAWRVEPGGELVRRLFHELDLLVAEALRAGWFDGLDDAALAALASVFVYEPRSGDDPPAPWFPSSELRERWHLVESASREIDRLERRHGVAPHRPPDPGFVPLAYAWVSGGSFAAVVADDEVTGGDFVRTVKQLIDLLRQIAVVAPDARTQATARRAADAAQRGVVAETSVLGPTAADDPAPHEDQGDADRPR